MFVLEVALRLRLMYRIMDGYSLGNMNMQSCTLSKDHSAIHETCLTSEKASA